MTEQRHGLRVAVAPAESNRMTVALLPPSATREARLLLAASGLRAVIEAATLVLPAYLLLLGYDALQLGVLATATLLGSALLTLAVGFSGARLAARTLLLSACLLMSLTGLGFAAFRRLLAAARRCLHRHAQPHGPRHIRRHRSKTPFRQQLSQLPALPYLTRGVRPARAPRSHFWSPWMR